MAEPPADPGLDPGESRGLGTDGHLTATPNAQPLNALPLRGG